MKTYTTIRSTLWKDPKETHRIPKSLVHVLECTYIAQNTHQRALMGTGRIATSQAATNEGHSTAALKLNSKKRMKHQNIVSAPPRN